MSGFPGSSVVKTPWGFPGGASVKNPPVQETGDESSITGWGGYPGGGNGNPLQYSCLEILWTEEPGCLRSMGSQKSLTRLGD